LHVEPTLSKKAVIPALLAEYVRILEVRENRKAETRRADRFYFQHRGKTAGDALTAPSK
jgi:hypothetical protein